MTHETGEIATAIFAIGAHLGHRWPWLAAGASTLWKVSLTLCLTIETAKNPSSLLIINPINSILINPINPHQSSSILIKPINPHWCVFMIFLVQIPRPSQIWKLVASFPPSSTWPRKKFPAPVSQRRHGSNWAGSSIEFHQFIAFLEMIFLPSSAFLAFQHLKENTHTKRSSAMVVEAETWQSSTMTLGYTWHYKSTASFHKCAGVEGIKAWQSAANHDLKECRVQRTVGNSNLSRTVACIHELDVASRTRFFRVKLFRSWNSGAQQLPNAWPV